MHAIKYFSQILITFVFSVSGGWHWHESVWPDQGLLQRSRTLWGRGLRLSPHLDAHRGRISRGFRDPGNTGAGSTIFCCRLLVRYGHGKGLREANQNRKTFYTRFVIFNMRGLLWCSCASVCLFISARLFKISQKVFGQSTSVLTGAFPLSQGQIEVIRLWEKSPGGKGGFGRFGNFGLMIRDMRKNCRWL